jgi:mannan endo-1,4-beta-mannosidase
LRHLLLIILALIVCTSAFAGNVNLRLGPQGEVLGWLVAGAFQNPTDKDFKDCKGFENDYIGEARARPVEGRKVSSAEWRLIVASPQRGIDLLPIYKTNEPAVAYGYATLVSKSVQDVTLLVGSDDGVKIWLNGALIHTNHVTRGVDGQTDRLDITLQKGTNRLLLKVDQHFGGWGFLVKVAYQDGTPASDLIEALDVQQQVKEDSPANSIVRMAVGKPEALSLDDLLEYTSARRKAEIWMPWFAEYSPIDLPLQSALINWSSEIRDARAAQSADALSGVLSEGALDLQTRFDAASKALRTMIQNPKPLIQAKPASEDYVRVAPGGRYFVHADGTFFTPLGYNHNPDWPQTYESAIGRPEYDPTVTDAFFKHLSECGVNLIRLMLESPAGGFLLEDPLGTFQPDQIAFLDNIVTLARKHDIKLMVTPWDTFWMNYRWDTNPYSLAAGGPVEKKVEFIVKPAVADAQKKRLKFMIDRWGNTGTIFAWEILNEADKWWDASAEQTQAWAKEMGDYVREYEKQRWGRNHLVCISTGHPIPDGAWGDLAYRQPGMDLASTHLYLDAAMWPDEPIGPAVAVRKGVTYSLGQIKDGRPYIDGENGPINRWIADGNLDDEVFHHMSWAHLASGGAGSSLRWPYRGPHHLSEGMYQHLGRMSRFVKEVPWQKLVGTPSEIKVAVPEGWVACSTGTSRGALVWVAAPKPSEVRLSIAWDGPETVEYRCYDTKSGEWIAKGSVKPVNGELSLPIIGERTSVAAILQ